MTFKLRVCKQTGKRYFFDPDTNESVWPSPGLPKHWGLLNNDTYVNVQTGERRATHPCGDDLTVGGGVDGSFGSAGWSPAPSVSASPARGGRRSAAEDDGGAQSTRDVSSTQPHPTWPEDTPFMSLLRQEWLSWHHRLVALSMSKVWSRVTGDSKTVRACRGEGLLPGLQGMHARFLFGQLRSQSVPMDPFLPFCPDIVDRDTVKELQGMGLDGDTARDAAKQWATAMGQAATACAQARASLDTGCGPGADPPVHGQLRLIALGQDCEPGKDGSSEAGSSPARFLLVYEPDPVLAASLLGPVRDGQPLPASPLFGPLNLPLYEARDKPGVAQALAQAGLALTPFTSILELNSTHYRKLALLYRLAAAGVEDPGHLPARGGPGCLVSFVGLGQSDNTDAVPTPHPGFLRVLYVMLARYETFSGNSSGLQGAVPHSVFDVLERVGGVRREAFASPLNCHFPRYCSAFPDVDRPFGSLGSFFDPALAGRPSPSGLSREDADAAGGGADGVTGVPEAGDGVSEDGLLCQGCFEANPPFVNDAMLSMAKRVQALLETAQARGKPLLFFIIVPSWTDAFFHHLLETSDFLRCHAQLARKEHSYIDGMQHRADRTTWDANVESTWFVLATDAAATAWPGVVGPAAVDTINDAFRHSTATLLGGNGSAKMPRVFKYDVDH